MAHAEAIVTVYAAGSLRGGLTEVARAFESETPGSSVRLVLGASGLLKDRLLGGESAEVFASANMEHPQALLAAGRAASVQAFARNSLCALTGPGFELDETRFVDRLLDSSVKVGISTPKADPSGDYAFEMFDRIEESASGKPGSAARLKAKALQLTGGPNSPPTPSGRSVYAMLLADHQADVFITYCTNAVVAREEQAALQIVPVPAQINVSAQYGLALLKGASPVAGSFVNFLAGPKGQKILKRHGFATP